MLGDSGARGKSIRGLAEVALASGLLVYVTSRFAPSVALDAMAAFALSFACVTAEILVSAWYVPALSVGQASLVLAGGAGGLFALYAAAAPAAGWAAALLTVALLTGATCLGGLVGRRIEQPGQLAAVAIVSAIADLWSVFDPEAPSARFAEQALAEPERLALFALPFPLLGTPVIAPVIGAGDIVFTALYVAAFRRHALSDRRLVVGLALAYGLALIGLLVLLRPLPLLPLLGAAAIASDPGARSLRRREWGTVFMVSIALLVLVALIRSR